MLCLPIRSIDMFVSSLVDKAMPFNQSGLQRSRAYCILLARESRSLPE
jgi:hypothetical protein